MARTKKALNGHDEMVKRFEFKGYVRCEFMATDKPDVRKWLEARTEEDFVNDLSLLVEDGYKVSIGPTARGMNAAIANVEGPEAWRGYMLSAWAADPVQAFHALCYKHQVLLDRDWTQVTDPEDDLLR